jgi:hypothetical protein
LQKVLKNNNNDDDDDVCLLMAIKKMNTTRSTRGQFSLKKPFANKYPNYDMKNPIISHEW